MSREAQGREEVGEEGGRGRILPGSEEPVRGRLPAPGVPQTCCPGPGRPSLRGMLGILSIF